ncbi:MAG: VapC toxin family PIN domain ribonuclease [Anaerolinea sp.]|nr:VapC toxin family PIN domain ribonuclease [Anaerolinea sp.]
MLIDANLLLLAVDVSAPSHERAASWLTEQLNGDRRVGMPWESLTAFVRISTHPRASEHPLKPGEAWRFVTEWLATPTVWVPMPTERHADVLGGLVDKHNLTGNLIPDAHLAAMAIEHGLDVCSADTDFARFTEIRWRNPLAG